MSWCLFHFFLFFFFNDTATTEIYTLSLHDALPIWRDVPHTAPHMGILVGDERHARSEEHTSELQSHLNLVCRLLLEKKKKNHIKRSQTKTSQSRMCVRTCYFLD